jgi:elongator complex protein 3
MKKATRTISGVTPVAVMAKPYPCPGHCVYCPSAEGAPKSYTLESPAVLRALRCGYDPEEQVRTRLASLTAMGHPVDKVELIVMGGTFLAYPSDYQYSFVKACFDALNGQPSPDLEAAQVANETSTHRCVGLCIETRPDWCGDAEVARLLEFGATRVELGVQTLDDSVHELTRRGHGVAEVRGATSSLRRHGFKVYYHWMPGLPGSSPESDLALSRRLFDEPEYRPDGLKLYPTVVVAGSELEGWYREGRFVPRGTMEMCDLLVDIKRDLPPYVRIARLMRDIPRKFIVAGCDDLALRSTVRARMDELGARCRCIRCREYGHRRRDGWTVGEPMLVRRDYSTADGAEIMLSYEDEQETLFGLLRLSICRAGSADDAATVRELHVFGSELELGKRAAQAAQHRGLGAALLGEAERVTAGECHRQAIRVLSGVGVRPYYRQLGYERRGAYMFKRLAAPAR